MTGRTWHCDYAPEFGRWPAQDCMTAYLTEEAWQAHLQRWHPSRRRWEQHHLFARPNHRSAMIDDELVITVRVRLTREEAADLARLDNDALPVALGRVFGAVADLPGQATGAELALPTFEPYQAPMTTEAP